MEIVIVLCLFMVIILLVSEKIVIKKITYIKEDPDSAESDLPEIMGKPKPVRSQAQSNDDNESHLVETEINPNNLDIEYDENEVAAIQIPQEELDEVFSNTPDFEGEEEEWNRYGFSADQNSLAQGVTYEELSAVGALIQKENLEQSQKETTASVVQKLQGTELFGLLESSVEGASRKIAELLDSNLSSETKTGSSSLRNDDLDEFDIGAFV
ncbi:MAG: conjugal transfer protein TraD [Xanthomarina gelatinilytica]|uniref:conjugal transfer protein TraD n=1 Tax=Xanthomarina gelatinilytica TaxID=1137281 RepID=UPI003A85C9AC